MHDDVESSDEYLSDEDVVKAFMKLYLKWKEEIISSEKQTIQISVLL